MKIIRNTAVLLATLTALAANATTYGFSYTFDDSNVVTGSMSGTLVGDYLQNISDVHVKLNGTDFSGANLSIAAFNTATHDWDNGVGARVSTKAALNEFIIADANVPMDNAVSNYFYFINDPAMFGREVFAVNYNTGAFALDNPANASWQLTAVVPEPASVAMLLGGLALIGVVRRRRAA